MTRISHAAPIRKIIAIALASSLLASCAGKDDTAQEVNLYTARHYDSDLALYKQFTEETGIRINRIEGNPDQLIERMKSEGANSPADLFVTADAGALWRAQEAGLFQPSHSAAIEAGIPANLREPNGMWHAMTRRARVVAYDSAKVKPEELDDMEKLASPRFKSKLCVRSADSFYNLSLVGAMIEQLGTEKAKAWVEGVTANMARPPQGGDRDQIRAVAAGICEVALTNSYYYIRMASGDDKADRKVTETVKLAFPSLGGKGVHVNISGAGIAAHAPHKENAMKLLEFLTSAETQIHIAKNNNEYPASPDIAPPAPVDAYANFTPNPMSAAAFAARQPEAQSMMSAAGWR